MSTESINNNMSSEYNPCGCVPFQKLCPAAQSLWDRMMNEVEIARETGDKSKVLALRKEYDAHINELRSPGL